MTTKAELHLPHLSSELKMNVYKSRKTFVNTSMRTKIEKGNLFVINKVEWKYLREDVLNVIICIAQIGKEGEGELSLNIRVDEYSDLDKLRGYFNKIFKRLGFRN